MKKIKQSLLRLIAVAGIVSMHTLANAQCELKVRLDVTPVSCKGDCNGTATAVDLDFTVPLFFFWSNGETTQTITGLCEGPLTLTVWQGSQNCSFVLNSAIEGPEEIKINCVSTVPVAPGTITTTTMGGTEPYNYVWDTNPVQTGSEATNLPEGSYMVIVTDANGCSAKANCDITAAPEECGGRTQTMGGWGAPPQGHNPASYMYANFAAAFPSGAQIGCTNILRLTTPQAVTDFLPSTSKAKVLPAGTTINPGQTFRSVLAGQAMALTLSIGFDYYDANFGAGNVPLGAQIINGGTFNGWTVNQLLAEANNKLGGCPSIYSLSQLNNALTMVNENYVGGNIDNGNLSCPNSLKAILETASVDFKYSVYPNPASDKASVSIVSSNDNQVSVDIYNMVGKKVAQVYNEYVRAQEEIKFNINTSDLTDGIYIINIHTSGKTYQQKLVVN
ncbi:MAG: T9SS type A sorting domain-containing protein [Bacteroidia bacterium]